jgi:hypothetical protein
LGFGMTIVPSRSTIDEAGSSMMSEDTIGSVVNVGIPVRAASGWRRSGHR